MKPVLEGYESVLVMAPKMEEGAQKELFSKIKKIVSDFKGKMHHTDTWGLRKLANPNKKGHAQGFYFHFTFTGGPGVVSELIRVLKMREDSIYHHFEKLKSSKPLKQHLNSFYEEVENSIKKEKERQARLLQRKKLTTSNNNNNHYKKPGV